MNDLCYKTKKKQVVRLLLRYFESSPKYRHTRNGTFIFIVRNPIQRLLNSHCRLGLCPYNSVYIQSEVALERFHRCQGHVAEIAVDDSYIIA